ncbi:MAG: substrate-binding domain-containing protein [Kiritimatiellae bacterium]|nr:substrate-binding domain-containing protein [Kiritimatiellia bacterium]
MSEPTAGATGEHTVADVRPTLGLLVPEFGTRFHRRLWAGVQEAALERGANLLCVGAVLKRRDPDGRFAVSPLAKRAMAGHIDALIVCSTITAHATPDEFTLACGQLVGACPVVVCGAGVPGLTSVVVDNYGGVYTLTTHLMEIHGHRRIAFLGASMGWDSGERLRGYADALKAHGLYAPELVVKMGRLDTREFYERERALLAGKLGVDAIVAESDGTAIRAVDRLLAAGVRVPDDVAVVGFDNAWFAEAVLPQLTTVDHPLELFGRRAAHAALDLLEGRPVPPHITVPVELVFRQSCGCIGEAVMRAAAGQIRPLGGDWEAACRAERDAILGAMLMELADRSDKTLGPLVAGLVDAFCAELKGEEPGLFLRRLQAALAVAGGPGRRSLAWSNALAAMRRQILPCIDGTPLVALAEDIWHQARALTQQLLHAYPLRDRRESEGQVREFADFSRQLINIQSLDELTDVLAAGLSRLAIPEFMLFVYDAAAVRTPIPRLVLAMRKGRRQELPPEGRVCAATELVPHQTLQADRPCSLVLYPLESGAEELGHIVFRSSAPGAAQNAVLHHHISGALKAVQLFAEQKRAAEQLEQAAAALKRSNEELQHFAYVASHDLQEPLRSIAGFIQLLAKRYSDKLDEDGREFIGFALAGAARLQRLINDLLQYSRVGTRGKPFAPLDCEKLFASVLDNLATVRADTRAAITHDPLPALRGDEVQLGQLFQNLLANAIKFRGQEPPAIHVCAREEEREWVFSVRDNGIGIDFEYLEKIFDIFQRLHSDKEYDGTGIGLAVCKKIVERHGGRIWAESEPGRGSSFLFTLAKNPADAPRPEKE